MGSVITLTSVNDYLRQLPRTQKKPRQQAIFVFLQQKQDAKDKNTTKREKVTKAALQAAWRHLVAATGTLPFIFINNFYVGICKATEMT